MMCKGFTVIIDYVTYNNMFLKGQGALTAAVYVNVNVYRDILE